ncbi:MAG: hypothetical protein NWF04_03885 [Candidatus Bathyarchaeota archaeon]|nr:hypothetical protein [Candidatus Bathyarchaeota archaeon]
MSFEVTGIMFYTPIREITRKVNVAKNKNAKKKDPSLSFLLSTSKFVDPYREEENSVKTSKTIVPTAIKNVTSSKVNGGICTVFPLQWISSRRRV